jgi:cutinase
VNFAAHNTYADDGSVISQGVDFAASRLQGSGVQPAAPQHGFGN